MVLQSLFHLRSRRSDTSLRRKSFIDSEPSTTRTKDRPKTSDNPSSAISNKSSLSVLSEDYDTRRPASNGQSKASSEAATPPRFSLKRFRNASDPQLSSTAKTQPADDADAPPVPAMPAPPAIITTAPTSDMLDPANKKKTRSNRKSKAPEPVKTSEDTALSPLDPPRPSTSSRRGKAENGAAGSATPRSGRVTFDEPNRASFNSSQGVPPPYDEEGNSSLALPTPRLSESSRSDASLGDHVYATQTTTHISTTTTIFRLPRRSKKSTPSLFPLPVKIPPSESALHPGRKSSSDSPLATTHSPINSGSPLRGSRSERGAQQGNSSSHVVFAASSSSIGVPGTPVARQNSTQSIRSDQSSPTLLPPAKFGQRGRSSTMSSLSGIEDHAQGASTTQSGRTSTSTVGRSSIAGFFNRSLFRQGSDGLFQRNGSPVTGGPQTPGSCVSKSNSFQLPRDTVVLPERDGDEPPSKYLERLQEAVNRGTVASVLSKSTEPFHKSVLRSYMRGFSFFEIPMDMAIRKLLMDVELPKETQQIDRVIEAFADRYHECNPGIYASPEQAYFIAFSLLILHTDVFNKNNKHKMQKPDYVKGTSGQGIVDGVLECFYDNISYTPFIHVEDEIDLGSVSQKSRKISFAKGNSADPSKRAPKGPVDPYTLIIDGKLEILRPSLQDVMQLEDPYDYLTPGQTLNIQELGDTFFRTGVLQIVSARSRPDAFMSPSTITNPEEASAGVVDIKVTKVGILWRKDPKKKKARSPWQEWGAVLTGTQLYFFKNTAWTKNLLNQLETHIKQGNMGTPVIFKPPLDSFKPDALMSTNDAVALVDSSYKKHKNAFMFVRHGGFEETFLADSAKDTSDWLAKLNYASAFRTAGVRMRGIVAGNYEGQRTRAIRRQETSASTKTVQTSTGEVSIQSGKIDTQLAQQILTARRQIMEQKILEGGQKIEASQKQLDVLLRNARHFRLLAPLQPRSREQLVLAAGRISAQLRWLRVELWRLKSHRDILQLDMKEEDKSGSGSAAVNQTLASTSSASDNASLSRLSSSKSLVKRSLSRTESDALSKSKAYGMDDIFQSPPELARHSSNKKRQPSWALPPLSFDAMPGSPEARASLTTQQDVISEAASTGGRRRQSANSVNTNSAAPLTVIQSKGGSTTTPSVDDGELELLKEAGLVSESGSPPKPSKRRERRRDADKHRESKDKSKLQSPDADKPIGERTKVRRSLHRTLRESPHVPTHHRSKKGKDSASSAGLADDASSIEGGEVLTRGTGSFTVHGKKASVVNFGSEWSKMSPEERLRMRKQAQSGDDSKALAAPMMEDESDSAAVVSINEERRGSEVSQSTTTNNDSIRDHPSRDREGGLLDTTSNDSFVSAEDSDTDTPLAERAPRQESALLARDGRLSPELSSSGAESRPTSSQHQKSN